MALTLKQANDEITRLNGVVADQTSQLAQKDEQLTALGADIESWRASILKAGAKVKHNADGRPELDIREFEKK